MNEIERLKTQLAVKEEMLKIKDEAFEKLLEENKELHNKIDKAVREIKDMAVYNEYNVKKVLEILEDNDE